LLNLWKQKDFIFHLQSRIESFLSASESESPSFLSQLLASRNSQVSRKNGDSFLQIFFIFVVIVVGTFDIWNETKTIFCLRFKNCLNQILHLKLYVMKIVKEHELTVLTNPQWLIPKYFFVE